MFSKFNDEGIKTTNLMTDTTYKINNNFSPFNVNNSALVKLNIDNAERDLDFDEDDINKIEKKLCHFKNQDLFSRENQVSRAFDEIIEVPNIIIKDEVNILAEDKKINRIKEQLREKEKEQDKQQRKIEMEINSKKIQKMNDKIKINKLQIRKKYIFLILKYILIILFSGFAMVALIILIDKYK